MMFVIFGRGETIIPFFENVSPTIPFARARQMEEEGVPSTALREVSLLQMLSESAFIVRLLKSGTRGRRRESDALFSL